MKLISHVLVLFLLLAVGAEATTVQVFEGDADGSWDHSAKKLRAMAMIYLAELGHDPSPDYGNGVSFSASGPAKCTIRMKRILPNGQIEGDSVIVADMDSVDDAVETMLTKSFGVATKRYKSEKPSEVFFLDPEFVGVDDSTANLAAKNTEIALNELGYGFADSDRGVKLQMFLVKLKNAYWLGMMRIDGSKILKAAHKKFLPNDDLEMVTYSLTNKVMDTSVAPSIADVDSKAVDYGASHDESCRVAYGAGSVAGFFFGLAFDFVCNLSDYMGVELAVGGKDLYDEWYPEIRFDIACGFTDSHAWLLGLDYVGSMGYTKSRWSLESVHRFSQKKGLFVDFIWGWGFDDVYDGWYMGGDIGLNLLASKSKDHWLSLMLRYDGNLDDFSEQNRISVNLVYNLRGYFDD